MHTDTHTHTNRHTSMHTDTHTHTNRHTALLRHAQVFALFSAITTSV